MESVKDGPRNLPLKFGQNQTYLWQKFSVLVGWGVSNISAVTDPMLPKLHSQVSEINNNNMKNNNNSLTSNKNNNNTNESNYNNNISVITDLIFAKLNSNFNFNYNLSWD